tara:strand:- start:5546 stop:7081 length:1536 start_codon:yes stop_codon:yes gene_type:complete
MARNPIYPDTAGGTAIDRLVNDTLPRILAQGQEAKRRKEELEYRRTRDELAQQNRLDDIERNEARYQREVKEDNKSEINAKLREAIRSENEGDFSIAYNYYMEADELASKHGLIDEFRPLIDRRMNTGAIESGRNNRFEDLFVSLESGDNRTFNEAYDKYLRMQAAGEVSERNQNRVSALKVLESKKLDDRFAAYTGEGVTEDYRYFNKKFTTDVANKVGISNRYKDRTNFTSQATMEGKNVQDYYKELHADEDAELAQRFLTNEVTGSSVFANTYNNASDPMKAALNKTITDAYRIANAEAIREQFISEGVKADDPALEANVEAAVQRLALSDEILPGVKVQRSGTPLRAEDAPPVPSAFSQLPKPPAKPVKKTSKELTEEFKKLEEKGYTNLSRKEQERFKELQAGKKGRKKEAKDTKIFESRKIKIERRIAKNEKLIQNYRTVLEDGITYTSQRASGPVIAYRSTPGSDFAVNNKTAKEIQKIIGARQAQVNKDKKAIESGFISAFSL